MSRTDICWTPEAIQYVTQIDVGGLDIDDPYADAVFRAIHRPLPVRRGRGDATSSANEFNVLHAFTGEIASNEPLLIFVTGAVGTGKSHLVRWLKSQIGAPPKWHIVYVEKRDTSLKRVIESILDGIDTPKAQQLRRALAEASSSITTEEEAMEALLMRLDQLVKFDTASEVKGLPGVDNSELKDLRAKADRLLGDYTFRKALCIKGGPIQRIVRLARGGGDPDESIDEKDLHLNESDFRVDPSYFLDAMPELGRLVERIVSNKPYRSDIAALCDAYLPRAKAEIFTGQTTDLLDIFQDVRREIASRDQELCLFIEDLVLLHGIDKQLAQALTVPASKDLCKLRAAIAVTEGYLNSVDTFTDRGLHFTLDIDTSAVGTDGLRDFVTAYLNAGRLRESVLHESSPDAETPNACDDCSFRAECHTAFGVSDSGYGFYPFNQHAVDRLVALASPKGFQPRRILREVIRGPLEVAEYEIPNTGTFPSRDFGKTLDENRKELPSEVRAKIRRENTRTAEPEISLRAFYAAKPLQDDSALAAIAESFHVGLTPGLSDDIDDIDDIDEDQPSGPSNRKPSADEIEMWANGEFLGQATARRVRTYVCDTVVAELRNGSYGLAIRKPKKTEWRVGTHTLRPSDVAIERSAGGGGTPQSAATFTIRATDLDAVLVRGIIGAAETGRLDTVDRGRWYFDFQRRIGEFAATIADHARVSQDSELEDALTVLAVLRHVSSAPGRSIAEALPVMLLPTLPTDLNPRVRQFVEEIRSLRDEALLAVRDARTTAKGTGQPSILDIGAVYATLRKSLDLKQIGSPPGEEGAARLRKNLAAKQSRASELVWDEIRALVQLVQQSLSTTEDLASILRNVDKLVDEGNRRGRLPRHNTRNEYQELRNLVESEHMSKFRAFATTLQDGPTPANLWDALTDPRSSMTALANYASFTNTLLAEMEAKLTTPTTAREGDPRSLIKEFRDLADEFGSLNEALR